MTTFPYCRTAELLFFPYPERNPAFRWCSNSGKMLETVLLIYEIYIFYFKIFQFSEIKVSFEFKLAKTALRFLHYVAKAHNLSIHVQSFFIQRSSKFNTKFKYQSKDEFLEIIFKQLLNISLPFYFYFPLKCL